PTTTRPRGGDAAAAAASGPAGGVDMQGERLRAEVGRWLAPVARRLGWVHPNTLTIGNQAVAALGALAIARADDDPALYLAGALGTAIYGVIDALDGVL